VFCVLGFILIAAPTAVEYHQVFLNGKPFAKAATINGVLAISVEDLAKAAGGTLTLEDAGFKVNGGTLNALISSYSAEGKHKGEAQAKIKLSQASVGTDQYKPQAGATPGNKAYVKVENRPLFKVNKAGAITNRLLNGDGKVWVPLSDVARAFGGVFNQGGGTLKPGETINLSFTSNSNAILVGL